MSWWRQHPASGIFNDRKCQVGNVRGRFKVKTQRGVPSLIIHKNLMCWYRICFAFIKINKILWKGGPDPRSASLLRGNFKKWTQVLKGVSV